MPSLKPILFTILACHIPIAASSTAIAIGEKALKVWLLLVMNLTW